MPRQVNETMWLVTFCIDEQKFALPLLPVERVLAAAAVIALPGAPRIVMGIVDIAGEPVPAVSLRRRFAMPDRELAVSDRFVVVGPAAPTVGRRLALIVDGVLGVIEVRSESVVPASSLLPGYEGIEGIVGLNDGLILIQQLDRCLSIEQARILEDAMRAHNNER